MCNDIHYFPVSPLLLDLPCRVLFFVACSLATAQLQDGRQEAAEAGRRVSRLKDARNSYAPQFILVTAIMEFVALLLETVSSRLVSSPLVPSLNAIV
jgi:hypothetical protein